MGCGLGETLWAKINLMVTKTKIQNLRDEDAFICRVKGVSCMTFGPSAYTDAKLLSWLLLDQNFLQSYINSSSG